MVDDLPLRIVDVVLLLNERVDHHILVKGEISFDSNNMGDWVIVKKDGVPTYNFAVAIDDHTPSFFTITQSPILFESNEISPLTISLKVYVLSLGTRNLIAVCQRITLQ
jgi:hypothetical protein